MTTLQALAVGAFWLAYYYFVLRKYNTLGFRLFSLFFFTSLSVCYWWYTDYVDLKTVEENGIATQGIVLKKTKDQLVFRFTDQSGKSVERTQNGGISVKEFASVQTDSPAPILYSPETGSDVVFLTSSYQRQINDNKYILVFPGLLFLIGLGCGIFLRKYRVHAHEGTMYEYVTDENGNVVLDDAHSSTTKSLRTYSTMSKLFQIFDR
ncbi:hypothetical protein [Larkinella rosea]|uniref:DUF3592 domain-containing protein n=1 Tax=Larkinella rosea TaxID=2025312 RepID=A0A3P1C366_9BACT|nr:hypothetical protein [Larkinella rosea]RRB07264.1 hypothetical protein EHT25_05665 [Larkinella rosea]